MEVNCSGLAFPGGVCPAQEEAPHWGLFTPLQPSLLGWHWLSSTPSLPPISKTGGIVEGECTGLAPDPPARVYLVWVSGEKLPLGAFHSPEAQLARLRSA